MLRAPNTSSVDVPLSNGQSLTFLDFFAGCGLVTESLRGQFKAIWANDISKSKAAIYRANHGDSILRHGSIEAVTGSQVPSADLSWASFPCQDLSLAGNLEGIGSSRSGLVWHWFRVMDEMSERPSLVVAENVIGLISAQNGKHYVALHRALVNRGYVAGAVVIDAIHWVPHSRPRVFVVAAKPELISEGLLENAPNWAHSPALIQVARGLKQWVWWRLPKPDARRKSLTRLIDFSAPTDPPDRTSHNLSLIPPQHRKRLEFAVSSGAKVFPGYKRTRNGRQVLELRFDDVAGCLRTPQGGSSRQFLILRHGKSFSTRLLTVREAARLMGVRSTYRIPGTFNEGYHAMGDAIAVPAVRHLGRNLLAPLAIRSTSAKVTS